jgi:acyl carrier protein
VLFSSINSVIGAPGVCDYASANAVLDAFVDSAVRPESWRQVVSLDWGPWREIGMAAKLVVPEAQRKEREALLRLAITPEAGIEAFAQALASRRKRLVLTSFDLHDAVRLAREQAQVRQIDPREGAGELATPVATQARPNISTDFEAPEGDIERRLAEIWVELLGVDRIGVRDDFFELGGHSLLATRVLARVTQALGARLSLRDIFEAPTIRQLAQKVGSMTNVATSLDGDREEVEF